ncbi:MAG TPA: Flp family type IVb pilin [Terriglobales bacterium]|nr:Flp family type IVb pilin [Terriglobales bacterium]
MVNRFRSFLTHLHQDEAGQGLVEYALIMGLIVFAAITTLGGLADEVNLAFSKIDSTLSSALSGP